MTTHKAVFLDRDQTLIEDPGYINHPSQVRLLPGVAQALIQMRKTGYLLVVVSNQSGVARGLVTEEALEQIHHRLKKLLADEGAYLDAIYYCPFHPEGVIPKYRCESDLRKPNPGMLLQAARDLSIDLSQSWMIGDSYRDIEAGVRAGCRTILIESPIHRLQPTPTDPVPDYKTASLREAANLLRMLTMQEKQQPPRPAQQTAPAPAPSPAPVHTPSPAPTAAPAKQPRQPQTSAPTSPLPAHSEPQPLEDLPNDTAAQTAEQPPAEQTPLLDAETHPVLQEILHLLRLRHREDFYEEFSFARMLATITGILSLFCLILSIWFWFDSTRPISSAQMTLGYAVVLQLLTIALLLSRKD